MDLMESVQYVFKDKDWFKKTISFVLIYVFVFGVPRVVNTGINVMQIVSGLNDYRDIDPAVMMPLVLGGTGLAVLFALLAIPVGFYASGYRLKVMDAVRKGDKALPEHGDIGNCILEGLKYMIVMFLYVGLPAVVLGIIVFLVIMLAVGTGVVIEGAAPTILLVIIGLAIFMVLILALVVLGVLIVPAATYEYLKNRSIGEALNFAKVFQIAKHGFKEFLTVWAYSIVVGMVGGVAQMLLFFVGFIVQPLFMLYLMYFQGHMLGSAFVELDKKAEIKALK